MPPIQHFPLGYYCVLFLLMGLAVGMNPCEKAIDLLFRVISMQTLRLDDNPKLFPEHLDYLFILDQGLIDILDSLKPLGPVSLPKLGRNKNEAFLNPVGFATEKPAYGTLKFSVKHEGRTGMGRIVCRGCGDTLITLDKYWDENTKELECLRQKKPRISANDNFGIQVALPWETSYEVLRADYVLTKLTKSRKTKSQPWRAAKAMLHNNVITIYGSDGNTEVDIALPTSTPLVTLDYIQSSIILLNNDDMGLPLRDIFVERNVEPPRTPALSLESGPCENAVETLLTSVSDAIRFLEGSKFKPLNYQFILDVDLFNILVSLKDLQGTGRNKNEVTMLSTVEFATEKPDYGSVKFTFSNDGKTGTGRIACSGRKCSETLSILEEYHDKKTKELWCLRRRVNDKGLISATKEPGVEVSLPWMKDKRYQVIRPDYVLSSLIRYQETKTKHWKMVSGKFHDKEIEFSGEGDLKVRVPLPDPTSQVTHEYLEVLLKLLSAYKEGIALNEFPSKGMEWNAEISGGARPRRHLVEPDHTGY